VQTLFITAAVIVAALYIFVPLAMWIGRTSIPSIHWELLDADTTIPHLAEAHFWKTTAFLSAQGFERAGARVKETMINGMANYAQLWRHSSTGETVHVATTLKDDGSTYSNSFVVFMHERENGGLVCTSNFRQLARVNLDPPGMSKLHLPSADLETVRAMHKQHCAQLGERLRPIRMRDGLTLCQALDAQTRTSALAQKRYRANGDALRITLWGAFYGIWINLWPLKGMYARRDRQWLYAVRGGGAEDPAKGEHRAA
jgi:hypothetical protein